MNIVIFSHPSFLGSQSMPRYTDWLRTGMSALGYSTQVWSPKAYFCRLPVSIALKKWMGYIDQYLIFYIWVKIQLLKSDFTNTLFVISDHALGPYVPLIQKYKHVIHCHDFLAQRSALGQVPENPTNWTGRIYQAYIRKGYRKGKNFICISKKTEQDLLKFLNFKPQLVEIVYNGLTEVYNGSLQVSQSLSLANLGLEVDLSKGYILHVGGNQWYKNRLGLIRIYNAWRKTTRWQLPLLLVGQSPSKNLKESKQNSVYSNNIFFLTNVSDELVKLLYHRAKVFLFPSYEEGFGWPIAEAMSCGCPVITTGEMPMNEVGGEAAIYIQRCPSDEKLIEQWAENSAQILEDLLNLPEEKHRQIISSGMENIKRFDSDMALSKINNIYTKIFNA